MRPQADFSRRRFVAAGFLSGLALRNARAQAPEKAPYPIIDSHIHFFDSSRPQGVPYGAGRPPALPEVYRFIAEPLGVVGAIEVEASPWVEDNLWVLHISQKATMMWSASSAISNPTNPRFMNTWSAITGIRFFAESGTAICGAATSARWSTTRNSYPA